MENTKLELQEDEMKYLLQGERCNACGHLMSLHNSHCCEFCMIDDCECEWGELEDTNKQP